MRTFIAVSVPVTPALQQLLARLSRTGKAKPVKAGGLHITLKFLGEIHQRQLPKIQRAMDDAACQEQAFQSELIGLGAFPNTARPNVLWIGLPNAEPLTRIALRLEDACAALGFDKEARAFTPHLTVMRFKDRVPPDIFEMIAEEATTNFGLLQVDHVTLYESDLTPAGPIYTPLSTHRLNHRGGS